MSIALSLSLDTRELRQLSKLTGKAKLAGAKALTFTAKNAQVALQAEAASTFHLRNAWVVKGVRITPATPGTMQATVGHIDKFMARHVLGDDKPSGQSLSIRKTRDDRGRLASGGLLVPNYGTPAQAPTHTKMRSKLRRMAGQKRKPFQIVSTGGTVMIVRRKGKERTNLETLAVLANKAEVEKRWNFIGTVRGTVKARFETHFYRELLRVS